MDIDGVRERAEAVNDRSVPVREPPASGTIPAKYRGHARRDAAAFYLTQLARGILAGELKIRQGERETSLATSEFLVLDIEVKQKKRANHVSVKLRWPKRPLIRIAAGRDGDGA